MTQHPVPPLPPSEGDIYNQFRGQSIFLWPYGPSDQSFSVLAESEGQAREFIESALLSPPSLTVDALTAIATLNETGVMDSLKAGFTEDNVAALRERLFSGDVKTDG